MDWSNLKADYERLGSYSAVAKEYGVSKGYVAQQAKWQGINPKPEGRSLAIDWSGLPDMYAAGTTFEQLAAHYGCSLHAIQNAMKRLDVEARPRGVPEGYEWPDERRVAHRAAIDRPEWRAKMRENLLKRLPEMRGPSANSPLEKLLQAALLKFGISFSTQRVLLGRYCVDILVDQAPVIIEADGSFHNLRKKQDAERDAALGEAGYRVFRFTGAPINRDAMGCVAKVVAEAGLTPDANPAADIRTGMMGSENPNWSGGPQTVACTYCGADVQRNAVRAKAKRSFCNKKCHGAWMREHPEESNRRRSNIDWSDLPSLYADGLTMRELGTHYGCAPRTVSLEMQRQGIQARPSGRRSSA